MDRILDSGSNDWGSTPHGDTKFLKHKEAASNDAASLCFTVFPGITKKRGCALTDATSGSYFTRILAVLEPLRTI